MRVEISSIELDASIQCRSSIDTGTVNDYAERMDEGDEFPPVELFADENRCWIGDGWHRVLAAQQLGKDTIEAEVRGGGRAAALKHALGANLVHGHRRTNADKRRCVEIALREFPRLSSRAVAKLCGVSPQTVATFRPQVSNLDTSPRTGLDGKTYGKELAEAIERDGFTPSKESPGTFTATSSPAVTHELAPPSNGMRYARMAIADLENIREDDIERARAFDFVKEWVNGRR